MRVLFLALAFLLACHADPEPRVNRASAYFYRAATAARASDDKPSCLDWGIGSADVAWCQVDKTSFYCTAGDVRWEKDEAGKWTNLGEPRCVVKISPPAPPQPAVQPPAPPVPTTAPPQPPAPAGSGAHP